MTAQGEDARRTPPPAPVTLVAQSSIVCVVLVPSSRLLR